MLLGIGSLGSLGNREKSIERLEAYEHGFRRSGLGTGLGKPAQVSANLVIRP
jgi:hypothetical protein